MATRMRTAAERRSEIREAALQIGIDDAYIGTLVESFYSRIRNDDRLGPVFNDVIKDWDPHLERMKLFWGSVVFGDGRYSGKPVPAHVKLENVTRDHFAHWLMLFEKTLRETAPSESVVTYFMERAQRIAHSLQMAMFETVETLLSETRAPETVRGQTR